MIALNISLICLSLKYINKKYKLISEISKWFYFELTKSNYKESKFIKSLNKKDFETIEILIKFNENEDLVSKYLTKYCSYKENYFDIVKLLINNGANIHTQNDQALMYASCMGCFSIVKLLIENGANIHTKDDFGLRFASHNGHIDIVKLLIDNGADIHAEDDFALKWTSYFGYFDIVKLLLDNGANIHAEDDYALRWAS